MMGDNLMNQNHSFIDEIIIQFPAKYLQGDDRISGKIEGILLFNEELDRLEFLITPSKDRTIIISYPIRELKRIELIPMGISKKKHARLVFDEKKGIIPTFRIKDEDLEAFIDKITVFRKQALSKPVSAKNKDKQSSINPINTMVSFFGGMVKGTIETVTKTLDISKKKLLNIFNPKSAPVPLEYEMMTLNGLKHVYVDSSEKISPKNPNIAIVLIHSIGGSLSTLEPIVSHLDIHEYRVLAYELRGHGMTIGDGGNFDLQNYVTDLDNFLSVKLDATSRRDETSDQSSFPRHVVFVSHSLSTAIVLEYLLRSKKVLKRHSASQSSFSLVLLSSGHELPSDLRKKVNNLPPIQLWRPFKRIIISKAKDYLVHPKNQQIADEFLTRSVTIPDKVFYQIFKSFIPSYHYQKELWLKCDKNIKNVLILRGDHDLLFSDELYTYTNEFLVDVSEETRIVHDSQIISTAGHLLPLEQPEKVASIIDEHVKSQIS